MKCDKCGKDLIVANSEMKSDIDSTDVYSVLTLVCVNPKCSLYAGANLNDPKHIAKKERMSAN